MKFLDQGFFFAIWVVLILSLKKNDPYLRCLNKEEKEQVVQLRTQGDGCLCSLRKENLTSWNDPETERARHIFVLDGSEDSGEWCPVTELPFTADKWCFTTVVLYNYLYVIGGYRQRVKRGWEFKMASFRFNPLTLTWVAIAPLIKVRQPSSLVSSKANNTKVLFHFSPMQTVIVSCIHSTGDTSAQWPVMAVFMLWEAGTWTHWWLRTLTRPSIQPWSAMIHGRTPGGLSLCHSCCLPPAEKHPLTLSWT